MLPLVAILKTLVATCGHMWPTCEMFAGNPITNSNPNITLTVILTKTLKLNPNLLSYWDCCQNMVKTRLRAAAQPRNVRYWHSAACCISGRRMSMIYCSQLHGKQEFRAAIYKCPPTSLLQGHAIWLHTPCWPLWKRALQ